VEPGAGEEADKQAGAVLHPIEPRLHQSGQLRDVVLGQVGQRPLQMRHTGSTGLSSWAYGGGRNTVSHGRAALISAIA
jgi:hypothetical protein